MLELAFFSGTDRHYVDRDFEYSLKYINLPQNIDDGIIFLSFLNDVESFCSISFFMHLKLEFDRCIRPGGLGL